MSDEAITFLILGAVVAVFVWDRLPVAIVAVGTALSLWTTAPLERGRRALDARARRGDGRARRRDLAVMGATLANGGKNPFTKERVIGASTCRFTLAVMATAGLYETSGDWLYDVGLPGKSGIGGGIITVSPGKGALGTFAPPLDEAGNSVKGQLVARFLARELGLDLFASNPVV